MHITKCCLVFCFLLADGLRLPQTKVDGQKDLSVAVCVTGGLRQFSSCSTSLHEFLMPQSTAGGGQLRINMSTYVVTWSDFENNCYPSVPESVKNAYKDMNLINCEMLSHQNATDVARGVLSKLSPKLYAGELEWPAKSWTHVPARWFEPVYMQSVLWESCLNMIPDDVDVVVKVRPDMCFSNSNNLQWEGRGSGLQEPIFSYMGNQYHLDDKHIYLFSSNIRFKKGHDDDTFFLGSRNAMMAGVASLHSDLDKGTYKLNDADYSNLVQQYHLQLPEPAFTFEMPWRPSCPEMLVEHHLRYKGLTDVNIAERNQVGSLRKDLCDFW